MEWQGVSIISDRACYGYSFLAANIYKSLTLMANHIHCKELNPGASVSG